MFGSTILDVAVGLAFVFLLLSLIASALREAVECWMKSRAVHLERGIRELLNDPGGTGLAHTFYEHPLVKALYRGSDASRRDRPSYIPARNFALALLDLVARGTAVADADAASGTAPPISFEGIRLTVHRIQNPPVQRAILAAVDTAGGSLARVQKNLEDWYDSAMDRVSGGYKRQTQWILLGLGLGLAIATNVDAIAVARHLYQDKAVREAVVQQAAAFTEPGDSLARSVQELNNALGSLGLPIGWPRPWPQELEWLTMLFGWIVTALAVSLGAPFWFDLLNKFMVIRSTVKPKEKSPEEGSEDRRPATPAVVAPPAVTVELSGGNGQAPPTGPAGAGVGAGAMKHEWAADDDPDRGDL